MINILNNESKRDIPTYTWTNLWMAAYRYTQKEANKWLSDLEKVNNKTLSSSTSTMMSKKSHITSMMKIVLKKCDKSLIKTELLLSLIHI